MDSWPRLATETVPLGGVKESQVKGLRQFSRSAATCGRAGDRSPILSYTGLPNGHDRRDVAQGIQ
jgi:hypothetical protein